MAAAHLGRGLTLWFENKAGFGQRAACAIAALLAVSDPRAYATSADVPESLLSIYSGWFPEVDYCGSCPRDRLYCVQVLAPADSWRCRVPIPLPGVRRQCDRGCAVRGIRAVAGAVEGTGVRLATN